jgi:hypothetical protein
LAGEVIKHGDVKCIMNEGMPMYKSPFEKGQLIITFSVAFPPDNWISHNKLRQLEKILPKREKVRLPSTSAEHVEECVMKRFSAEDERKRRYQQQRMEAYDSDDDEGHGGQRVQCAQH